ncbi:hypothetical protein BI344_07025 [Chromobacterium sphagni]|uniref:HTH lysR-type domain-containing protein n=1 Tax=Chromobacterium sphagni TaxID=1903179 RepID=A0ABX3CDJ6_9NEIS|nr:hypothetical protein BI344_07025 [Chromobacterium sphagni]
MTVNNIDAVQLRKLDLNSLVALHALLSTRSVSLSAARLCLGQPAVSHILKRLRALTGDELLCRHGRRMLLTPLAESLLAPLEAWLEQGQRLLQPQVFDPAALQAEYRLAMPDLLEAALLPALIAALQAQAPGLILQVVAMPADQVESALEHGRIDGALGYFPQASARLGRQPLFISRFVCFYHAAQIDMPAALRAEDLARPPHIHTSYAGNSASLVDDYLRGQGRQRRVIASTASLLAIPLILERLPAVAVLPDMIAGVLRRGDNALEMRRLADADLRIGIEHLWHPRRNADPLQQFFNRLVQEQSAGLAGREQE